ncbi:prolyl aminopeptidase [Umezawaea sp. Da 62-37]|uniref:prolyl aminopeptidase n=1 Tax=Umezawaea sp. Da 62-37 TaxID=3075927 RepID=UPI0028F6EAE9|nr:prolyl aminopeptidase [Umezawaea sp. Da 62-37]WNV90906.1 prolyl aminopeptidase [Umezawaea sp. Da 62-37]
MTNPFPPIEPHDDGFLDVGDGNTVHWKVFGNPEGKPVVILHGGPGSGSPKGTQRSFDPTKFRIVLFDQRGCGRSTPHASDPATDMSVNTTDHLLRDTELLREHLGVDRWLVFGGSWGTTLALAYAERFPERVTGLILVSVTTSTRAETDWLYRGVGRFFPAEWAAFRAEVPDGTDLLAGYLALLSDPDPDVRSRAATAWCAWEDAVLSMEISGKPDMYSDKASDAMVAMVRICAHYGVHGAWLEEGALLRDVGKLADIPAVLVHGRRDMSCPAETAWKLAKAWPGAELHLVEDSGHRGGPDFRTALGAAVAKFTPS